MPVVQHSTEASISFLLRWAPEGPWHLVGIVPDGRIEGAAFTAEQEEEARAWIEARQGKQNLYFHVNPLLRDPETKAEKKDVAALAWLHIDIDPRAGENFEEERIRALRLLQNFEPRPTVIIDSGGGYQGFWRLLDDDRLRIDGDVSRGEELEAYNIQLEKLFGADHCHNCDRIMRLPGTVNLPNERKRKKGRKPASTRVVEWSEDAIYPIDLFTAAVRVQTPEPGLVGGRPKVKISGNINRFRDSEELRERFNLSDAVLALLVQGTDPVDPTRYPSRSEALWRACCEMVRADMPDEAIFSVITDPNFEISRSVLDKPNAERYALRQIEKAREEAVDPWLRKMNERHAVISDMGGKCRIISEVYDPAMKRSKISRQSFEDFRNRYRHIRVEIGRDKEGKPIHKPVGHWWIDHAQRRQYETIVFAPGRDVDSAYNLWRGFACDALPGDRHEMFLRHIRENICGGNEEYYNYLVRWMARTVQEPDSPGETAVVLRGKRGTGKSFFAKQFGRLFGRHFLQVSNSQHLVGNFNAHLRDAVVLFGDEAFYAGDKRHESVLKTLVTEELIIIEGKGIDAEAAPNFCHILLASNELWVVPAGVDERRFFVLDVGDDHKQDTRYFADMLKLLDTGGRENLLHFLLNLDLSDFNVRVVPQTSALQEQKVLSMAPEEQWFHEKLLDGRLLRGHNGWQPRVLKDALYDDYIAELRDQGRNFRLGKTAFGKFLQRALPDRFPVSRQELADIPIITENGREMVVKRRAYYYYLPALEAARAYWDRNFGGPYHWPGAEPDQAELEAAGIPREEPEPF